MTMIFKRHKFLSIAGSSVFLPALDSIAAPVKKTHSKAKRLIFIGLDLGVHTPNLFPTKTGFNYEKTPLLEPLWKIRDHFTVFSGLDHRALNGHSHWSNYLIGNVKRGISIDQIAAHQIGDQTRFSSLQIGAGKLTKPMSFTKAGTAIPMIYRPSALYQKLFASGMNKKETKYLLSSGKSILDFVLGEAKGLKPKLSHRDHHKLQEYFASIRGVEENIQKQIKWMDIPKKQVDYALPQIDPVSPDQALLCEKIMYDLMELAIINDTSRVYTMMVPGGGPVFTIDGEMLSNGYHGLSHHGNDPRKIAEFVKINKAHLSLYANFIDNLSRLQDEEGEPYLNSTMALFGSGMGDSNLHDNSNLPIILAGGGFKHGQHLGIERSGSDALLLGDLFITMLNQMGIQIDRFANASKGFSGVLS